MQRRAKTSQTRQSPQFVRGPALASGLLVLVLVVAIAGAVVGARQLDAASKQIGALTDAADALDGLVRVALVEQASVQSALGIPTPRLEGVEDPFTTLLRDFTERAQRLHLNVSPQLARIGALHRQWEATVASTAPESTPARNRRIARAAELFDDLRSETTTVRSSILRNIGDEEERLRARIFATFLFSVGSVTIFALIALAFALARSRMMARYLREHYIVEHLQAALRVGYAPLPETRVGTAYVSATREAEVGGDFFDMWREDADRGYILVADVSGKGVEAAVNTAFVKYAIRTLASQIGAQPHAILAAFNALFLRTVEDPTTFAVAFLALYDRRTQTLTYASAGSGQAFLRRGEAVSTLAPTGPIVGVIPEATYESASLRLEASDLLVVTTDGFTEARNGAGEMLDQSEALALIREGSTEPQRLCRELVAAVRARSGGTIADDLAVLVIRVEPQNASRGTQTNRGSAA